MAERRKVLLGVTGSVAAYKAAVLLRELQRRGCDVWPVMTAEAADYVGPLTFRALSNHPVPVGGFAGLDAARYEHLDLSRGAAAMVVAPCTANTMARLAAGLADDVLSAAALSLPAGVPLWIAPAMNTRMWEAAATRENAQRLAGRGVRFIGPESGPLGCGEEGAGRMVAPERIAESVAGALDAAAK